MSGISRIQSKRDGGWQSTSSNAPQRRELWFKDGDQAFLTSVATGDEGDSMFDEVYLYTFKDGQRWTTLLADADVDTSKVPDGYRPSHKFAFWAYVYEVIHAEKRSDDWQEITGAGGKKAFKEEINDYRIISLSFGRSDYIWNQVLDLFNDWGQKLDGGVMRVKRTGTGMYDTSYTVTATARNVEVPDEKQTEKGDLPTVKGYFKTTYGGEVSKPEAVSVKEEEESSGAELF